MITQTLVKNCLNTTFNQIPEDVIEHAKKSMLNWIGVAIGAANHPSVDMVLSLREDIAFSEQVSILGRKEKADLLFASLINGMSSHIFDFDDTHLDTIHHPSGPVAPVVFALGEKYKLPGTELLRAFTLGCEAELRISNAVYPSHYDIGWHITSSTGGMGAAVAAGILLGLTEEQMIFALGIAGTQSSGLREMFGSMTKPFHPGKAAQNGLLAALLAKKGFTSSRQVLEAKRGFANVLAPERDLSRVNENWGTQWELSKNTFKPYACGIVLHPAIDACIALGRKVNPDAVEELQVYVNPYVLELTGKPAPNTGLEGKFSIFHTASAAFIEGDASQEQYSDEKVQDPEIVAFREKVKPTVDSSVREDQARAVVILKDGSRYQHTVQYATGSINNPMTDEALLNKFNKLTVPVIGENKSEGVIKQVKKMETLENLGSVLDYCC